MCGSIPGIRQWSAGFWVDIKVSVGSEFRGDREIFGLKSAAILCQHARWLARSSRCQGSPDR